MRYSPPTPFRRGDILRIDCLPYAPADRYCIVLGSYGKSCDLICAYPTLSGQIGFGSVDFGYYYENQNDIEQYLPPLFRAELYSGELPENCAWMAELSEKLRERPELSEKLVGRKLSSCRTGDPSVALPRNAADMTRKDIICQ